MVLKSEIEKAFLLQQQKIKRSKQAYTEREKIKTVALDTGFIQVISGIRRCGKSTLMRFLMSNYTKTVFFNFEDPRIVNFEVADFDKLDEIIPLETEAYFFDEIQNVPQWEVYIRQLHDDGKKVFVTGSNASLLSKELGTRLTGRYLNTELFPFSYQEYLNFEKKEVGENSIKAYLKMGGFPEYLKSKNPEVLHNLLKDIVLRDIAVRYSIRNTKVLLDIVLYLLSNVSKEMTYNSLRKVFQVGSTHTVVDYLTWAEDAYLLFFVQKFSWSAKRMAVNPRKVYAIDNGFIDVNSLSFSEDKGRVLENAVFLFLRNKGQKMYYFKEKYECDFVLFTKKKCTKAVQVCQEITTDNQPREFNGLLEAMNYFNLKEGIIITQNQKDEFQIENKTVKLIPCFEYFLA
ncbi:MAG: ATP-binding protein [Polaribacter sp.]